MAGVVPVGEGGGQLAPRGGAERVLSQLDVDPDRFGQHIPTLRGAIIRARAFDRIAAAFAAAHPGGLVVSLGAGLDTRADRVAAGGLAWADVDLPAVAALRGRLLPADGNRRLVAGSVTDPAWAAQIGWEPGRPVLLIAEAVLIYLHPAEVRAFLSGLGSQFPTGAQIALDYGAPLMIRNSSRHPGLKNTDARFCWSARGARRIARLHPRLRALADRNLAGSAVMPGRQGRALAAASHALRTRCPVPTRPERCGSASAAAGRSGARRPREGRCRSSRHRGPGGGRSGCTGPHRR